MVRVTFGFVALVWFFYVGLGYVGADRAKTFKPA